MKSLQFLLLGAYLAYAYVTPANARVTISSPSNGATVGSPLHLIAAASQGNSIYVYANSKLVFQQSGSSIDTNLTLTAGSYTLNVVAHGGRRNSSSSSVSVTVSSAPPVNDPPTSTPSTSVADQIAADMQGKNEGFPHGVPLSYDWANGPVIDNGNNSNGDRAITAWGVIYVASQGNPATNTRVNIRDVQLYFLQKSTGKWLLLQNTNAPDGDAYPEDYQGDSKNGDSRTESDGSISVTAGNGYNFHFYPSNRGSIDPNDIGGVVALFEARLIVGNPALADDRSSAQYLASAGADYYPSVSGPGIENNPSVGNGKMKYVQIGWRSFAMTTLTQAQLESNPPPISLSGIQP